MIDDRGVRPNGWICEVSLATSLRCRTSGGPYFVHTIAFIFIYKKLLQMFIIFCFESIYFLRLMRQSRNRRKCIVVIFRQSASYAFAPFSRLEDTAISSITPHTPVYPENTDDGRWKN